MDQDNATLIEECQKYGIPVVKKNGQMYTNSTLMKKLKTATSNIMRGGAKNAAQGLETAVNDVEMRGAEGLGEPGMKEDIEMMLPEESEADMPKPRRSSKKAAKNESNVKISKTSKKSPKMSKKSKVKDELLENPLGPVLEFHVDYNTGNQGQAILEDPLIQAYFHRLGVPKIEDTSEIPVGLAMAVYGNHAQLGDSGLSKRLPNVLENPNLQEYWNTKGVTKVTPQTMIPVKFLYFI